MANPPNSFRMRTPQTFLFAVKEGDVDSVREHLDGAFDQINYAEPETGLTALHYAAAYDARVVLKLLIATGKCDYHARDRKGRTAATLAFEVADNPAVGRLLYKKMAQTADDLAPHPGSIQRSRNR